MTQLDLESLIVAIDRHRNVVSDLTDALVVATEAMQALGAVDAKAPVDPDAPIDAPINLESLSDMTDRIRTLFNTDGIEGVFPPALPSLLRAGGHEATINEAVYQLTQDPVWLELHSDGMLRKV